MNCQQCGATAGHTVIWDHEGKHEFDSMVEAIDWGCERYYYRGTHWCPIDVKLRLACLDHDPKNRTPLNLKLLCQHCFRLHMRPERRAHGSWHADLKRGQMQLIEPNSK